MVLRSPGQERPVLRSSCPPPNPPPACKSCKLASRPYEASSCECCVCECGGEHCACKWRGGGGLPLRIPPAFFKAVQACFEVVRIPCLAPPPNPAFKKRASVLLAVRSNKSHLKIIVFANGGGSPPQPPPLFYKPPKRASMPYESLAKLILRDCVCKWGGGGTPVCKRAFSSTNRSQNSVCEHRFAIGGGRVGAPNPPGFLKARKLALRR